MQGWAIPQDNGVMHHAWSDKNNWNTASIFQIMHKCCFAKIAGEHNNKKTIIFFILWEYIFKKIDPHFVNDGSTCCAH